MCAGIHCALSQSELYLCVCVCAGIGCAQCHSHSCVCVCVCAGMEGALSHSLLCVCVCVGLFSHVSEYISLLDFYQFAKEFNH